MDVKRNCARLAGLFLAALAAGCLAVPVGHRHFSAEYPGKIRPTGETGEKTFEAFPEVSGPSEKRVEIGLAGNVTETVPQVRHWERVTVSKEKVLAFGLFPTLAQDVFRRKDALERTTQYYTGNGNYSSKSGGKGASAMTSGMTVNLLGLGAMNLPFTLLHGIFGPFEQDWHYLGKITEVKRSYQEITNIRDPSKLELLQKFSPAERKEIGVWTWRDDAQHPQNTFWHGFSMFQWVGVCKYCNYVVHDPVETGRTEPASPKTLSHVRHVEGPYAVTLHLPDFGWTETLDVPPGRKGASFSADALLSAANGRTNVQGRIRFRPPPGGWDEVADAEDRALLEKAAGRTWNVTFVLPPPPPPPPGQASNLPPSPPEAREVQPAGTPPYSITAIEQAEGSVLIVRVRVEDTSRTFEIDRLVQPEVRRLFREQFAAAPGDGRREQVRWKTEDGGRTIVYRAEFADGSPTGQRAE